MNNIYKSHITYNLPRLQETEHGIVFYASRSHREIGMLTRYLLKEQFASDLGSRRRYIYAFETVLFNLVCSALYQEIYNLNIPCVLAVRRGNIAAEVGYTNLNNALKWLDEQGYVDIVKGYKNPQFTYGLPTKLRPTTKLLEMVAQSTLEPTANHRDLIICAGGDIPESRETIRTRKLLKKYNALVAASDYTVRKHTNLEDARDVLLSKKMIMGTLEVPLNSDFLVYNRIFKGDMKTGGRLYGGIQSLPRPERYSVTIDGEPAAEIDFKSLHPRLLWAEKGLDAPEDCYAIKCAPRGAAKKLLLVAFNCKSRSAAISAARRAAVKDGMDITGINWSDALDELMELHAPIKDGFFSCCWGPLQYSESCIMLDVIEHFTNKGIVCLGVHDSAIVQKRYENELKEVMEVLYKQHTGRDCPVEIKD